MIKKKNILLVEDNPTYSMFLSHYLHNHIGNVNITVCETGKEAIRQMENFQPDAVILDYFLEDDMTGLDILKKLKAKYSDLIVIVLSSQQEIDTAVELMKEGAHSYISKSPESANELLQSIERAFSIKEEENRTLNFSIHLNKSGIVKYALIGAVLLVLLLVLLQIFT